jgi:hypothetical protein
MVIANKEHIIIFQNPLKLMFNKYNKKSKWVKGISIHIFMKNQNSIRCVTILKVMFVLILWLVLEIETPKSN